MCCQHFEKISGGRGYGNPLICATGNPICKKIVRPFFATLLGELSLSLEGCAEILSDPGDDLWGPGPETNRPALGTALSGHQILNIRLAVRVYPEHRRNKRFFSDIRLAPREGALINGLILEGARWDPIMGCVTDSVSKELFPVMPVIHVKAVVKDKLDSRNVYECPVYRIKRRGPTYVWTFNLKTRQKPSKWVLAGVAILLGV